MGLSLEDARSGVDYYPLKNLTGGKFKVWVVRYGVHIVQLRSAYFVSILASRSCYRCQCVVVEMRGSVGVCYLGRSGRIWWRLVGLQEGGAMCRWLPGGWGVVSCGSYHRWWYHSVAISFLILGWLLTGVD